MDTTSSAPPSTHKRTSSAAGNTTIAPETKRRVEEMDNLKPNLSVERMQAQQVYVVMVESASAYGESSSEIRGVYATLNDANNVVRKIANKYNVAETCERGTEVDGRVYWSSDDVGEGEVANITIQLWEVMGPGSVPETEFLLPETEEGDTEEGSADQEDYEEEELDEEEG